LTLEKKTLLTGIPFLPSLRLWRFSFEELPFSQ